MTLSLVDYFHPGNLCIQNKQRLFLFSKFTFNVVTKKVFNSMLIVIEYSYMSFLIMDYMCVYSPKSQQSFVYYAFGLAYSTSAIG